MTKENLQNTLLQQFPELSEEYLLLQREWGGEPVPDDCVFGDLFGERVVHLSRNLEESRNREELERALGFVEDMLKSPDFEVRSIAEVSVLEHVLDRQDAFEAARPLLGTLSAQVTDSIWRRWKGL